MRGNDDESKQSLCYTQTTLVPHAAACGELARIASQLFHNGVCINLWITGWNGSSERDISVTDWCQLCEA